MSTPEQQETLRLIEEAIKIFPKVLERQRRAGEHKMKMIQQFEESSRALLKYIEENKEKNKNK